MSGRPELHSCTRCETLAHRIEKMPTRGRLCEQCFRPMSEVAALKYSLIGTRTIAHLSSSFQTDRQNRSVSSSEEGRADLVSERVVGACTLVFTDSAT